MRLDPLGFRDCDARWRYDNEIDDAGMERVGLAFGTLLKQRGVEQRVLTGHDFRSYSPAVAAALIRGLRASGCAVLDMGLTITPAAYFTQMNTAIPALAMVTASHNPDGWTGVKFSLAPRTTLLPPDMDELRELAKEEIGPTSAAGTLATLADANENYIQSFGPRKMLGRKLRAVVACGHGTASLFAPRILAAAGVAVVELDCELDASFPRCDPNPEDLRMLGRLGDAVRRHRADVGFALDGDGDRCGFADETGAPVSADKAGLLLARHFAGLMPAGRFIVDVKSTGLFATDPVLRQNGATTEYWKTGHSYMRRRLHERGATAAFEKSGHFFFNSPFGNGFDDGCAAALAVSRLLAADGRPLSARVADLDRTWVSPTMSPACADSEKHRVVAAIRSHFEACQVQGQWLGGQPITCIETICGVRFTLADGSWGLVRASSNKPELAVVCESPTSPAMLASVFAAIEDHLASYPEVGAFNQKLAPVA